MGNIKMAELMESLKKTQTVADPLMSRIRKGNVIPIISSSFRIEQIFRELAGEGELTVVEQLISLWAARIGYPMQESYNLARVAQYYLVENDDPNARIEIVNFLKEVLLRMANPRLRGEDISVLIKQYADVQFSDLATKLEYPIFPERAEDPLRVLARFPLPIYITTSQSNFMERALQVEGKDPCTQICFWSGDIANLAQEHLPNPGFNPTVMNPLVYHLYGLEDYPQTLVLSEDDYINFLISVVEDTNTQNPKVPLTIRRALRQSQLLLIGYRLSNWDFRMLFRFILKYKFQGNEAYQENISPKGMLIQLKQKDQEYSNEKTLVYLSHYFEKKMFEIKWSDADAYIQGLWNEWNQYRQSQL